MERGIPVQFANSAGSYCLLKLENGRAWYRFTNRGGKAAEANVPIEVWQRLAAQARASSKEGADGAGELQRVA